MERNIDDSYRGCSQPEEVYQSDSLGNSINVAQVKHSFNFDLIDYDDAVDQNGDSDIFDVPVGDDMMMFLIIMIFMVAVQVRHL